ncbi:MAG: hypothetical protein FWD25_02080 [Clostridia bacterium]|nr:hypothetical protein [Clostridia bacterium]
MLATSKNTSKMLYVVISAAAFAGLFLFANSQPFWSDELCQITFSGTAGSWRRAMLYDPHTPPLYDIALFFWYRLAPYGERWLLLLSQGAFAITVFVTGLVGEKIRNRRTGLLAASLMALNGSAILACGWELRPQAFMLLFCVLSLYEWVARVKKPGFNTPRMLRYAAWMALSGYSHYFGVLFSGMLFLMDCFLALRKKMDSRYFLSYALALLAYIPWLRLMLGGEETGLWQPVPSLQGVAELLRFLSGENLLILGLFVLAVVFAFRKSAFVERAPVVVACLMILVIFVYGRFIAWRSTFWVPRYFSALFPCVMVACALALDTLLQAVLRRKQKIVAGVCVGLMLFAGWNTVQVIQRVTPAPYRAAAEWLFAQGDPIYASDTIVISSDGGWPMDGWNEYYITKQGRRDPIHLVDVWTIGPDELLRFNRVYHSTYGYWGLPESLRQTLEEHYVLLGENQELYIRVYGKQNQQ